MTIEGERQEFANQLASVVGSSQEAIDRAILTMYERMEPEKRHMVSILALVAWLIALLRSLPNGERMSWVREGDGATRLDRLLRGEMVEMVRAVADLSEALAGPYDVGWDGNWPERVARQRLRGRMPTSARPGDILIGGDHEGARIDIRVVEESDGVLTGEVLAETWRDPPLEEVWTDTYGRLESLYPEEVPRS